MSSESSGFPLYAADSVARSLTPGHLKLGLAKAGYGAFTSAQLLGHSDVRVTMRYVRAVEDTKRVAVEAIKLSARKNVQVLASWPKQPPRRRVE